MTVKLGPLGTFSQGKISEDDGGDLQIGVAADKLDNVVIIAFGSPVAWIGMDPERARSFAKTILAKADELEVTRVKS